MSFNKTLRLLLFAYVVALGFTEVLHLSSPFSKLQIPELIFIPLFLVWLIRIGKDFFITRQKINSLEGSLVLLSGIYIASSAYSGSERSWMETIGLIYLFFVFLIFKTSVTALPRVTLFIRNAFVTCGIIAAFAGITGFLLYMSGINSPLAWDTQRPYPYFGYAGRAQGFADTPNMLLNVLGICFLIFYSHYTTLTQKKPLHLSILIVLMLGILFTFSKSIILLIICTLYIWSSRNIIVRRGKMMTAVSAIALFLLFILLTHVLVVKKANVNWQMLTEEAYSLDHPFMETEGYYFVFTNYAVNKKAAVDIGLNNFWTGVGPGNFNNELNTLKENGDYPSYFPNYDPHSTFLGVFAETGIAGFACLMFIFFSVVKQLRKLHKQGQAYNSIHTGLTACFLFLAMEAISLDILNFRHLWILLGLLAALIFQTASLHPTRWQRSTSQGPGQIQHK